MEHWHKLEDETVDFLKIREKIEVTYSSHIDNRITDLLLLLVLF